MADGLMTTPTRNPLTLDVDPNQPALWNVDPAKETVAGQLESLTAKESGLMTQARTKAAQSANARGLLNTSIATEAGESAALGVALPIAQSDAAIHGTAAQQNQAARNTFGLSRLQGEETRKTQSQAGEIETGLIGTRGGQERLTQQQAGEIQSRQIGEQGTQQRLTQAEGATQEQALFQQQAAQQTAMQQLVGQQNVTIQQLQSATATDLANIEATYKTLMQTSATAAQVMATAQQGINDILKDTTLSNDAKSALILKLQDGLKAQMGVVGALGGVDLSALLVFPSAPITPPATTTPTTSETGTGLFRSGAATQPQYQPYYPITR